MSRPVLRIAFAASLAWVTVPGASACPIDAYLGSVCTFAFARSVGGAPGCPASGGWVPADGALLPINGNEGLFELLQTTYGGDGTTTFALPDLRGRVAASAGKGPGMADVGIGETFGTEALSLAVENLPPHEHPATSEASVGGTLRAQSAGGNQSGPTSNVAAALSTTTSRMAAAAPQAGIYGYAERILNACPERGPMWFCERFPDDVSMHPSSIAATATVTTTTGNTGGGQPFVNMQPSLVMSQCIRVRGAMPPRP